jgi:hypothetical protein
VFAVRRQHQRPRAVVSVKCFESVSQRIDHIHVKEIVGWSLYLDKRNVVVDGYLNVTVSHVIPPSMIRCLTRQTDFATLDVHGWVKFTNARNPEKAEIDAQVADRRRSHHPGR